MISINVRNNIVVLSDIEQNQLGSVLYWYNMSEDYRFATGIDGPVSMEMLEAKFLKTKGNGCEFFLGIHGLYENRIIGIFSGRLSGKILWINILAVGLEFQGKGYGRISVELLLKHLKLSNNIREVYLAVADKNLKGHSFWINNGFVDMKNVNNKLLFDGKKYNVIIMHKRL